MPGVPAARVVEVHAHRLGRWVAGFEERHGRAVLTVPSPGAPRVAVLLSAPDGATAALADPWPAAGAGRDVPDGGHQVPAPDGGPAVPVPDAVAALAAHVLAPRRTAVLLVRRGGYACAVVDGGRVTTSKVGNRYVQGRTAAGGWSQQRFARRREKQTDELSGAAADVAARLLLDPLPAWLATGGDRPLLDRVLADPRLRPLRALPRGPHLQVGDPRADLVRSLPELLTRVPVTVTEPAPSRA